MPSITDKQVTDFIADYFDDHGKSASALLNYFRMHKIMSCEQKRFKRLFDEYVEVSSTRREVDGD